MHTPTNGVRHRQHELVAELSALDLELGELAQFLAPLLVEEDLKLVIGIDEIRDAELAAFEILEVGCAPPQHESFNFGLNLAEACKSAFRDFTNAVAKEELGLLELFTPLNS